MPVHFSPETAFKSASHYLKLSHNTASTDEMLVYRLQAAALFIQAGEPTTAQRILRETRFNTQLVDPTIRQAILETRLSLVKKEYVKAQEILKKAHTFLSTKMAKHSSVHSDHDLIETPRIALLLPSRGPHAKAAKTIRDGFLAAYYQETKHRLEPNKDPEADLATKSNHSDLIVNIYDTADGSKIHEAYKKALEEHANFIVGPLTKAEVQAVATMQLPVPVLALNTISENVALLPPKLYQFGIMPEDEVIAVLELALQQGKRKALILVPKNEWGKRLALTFQHYWEYHQGTIIDVQTFKSTQDLEAKIRSLLKVKNHQRRQDADMIFLGSSPEIARQVKPLLNFYHAEDLPVYATASVYAGTPAPLQDQDLNGVQFCDMPWVLQQSSQLQEMHNTIEKSWDSVNRSPRFFALGMDAFQLATQMSKTQDFPPEGISGFTGRLQLNPYQRIQRKLVCTKFEQGIPTLN
jgi:outer membrane PBP1 activator LpoA protein